MRNVIFLFSLIFCVSCGDDVIIGGTETEGLLGYCGDRIVDENEECDEFTKDCSNCVLARRIFVTSDQANGIFAPKFDSDCSAIAEEAGLNRGLRWLVWLSSGNNDASNAIFHSPFRYERVDGEIIANNFDDLTDGSLMNPINVDEHGNLLEDRVWTGTNDKGLFSGTACLNWNNANESLGTFGWTTSINSQWTDGGVVRCSERIHVYCIEDRKKK